MSAQSVALEAELLDLTPGTRVKLRPKGGNQLFGEYRCKELLIHPDEGPFWEFHFNMEDEVGDSIFFVDELEDIGYVVV